MIEKIIPYFEFEDVSIQLRKINTHFDKLYELGSDYENGTIERVENATKRAIEIFEKVFKDNSEEVTLVIYEFPEPNPFNTFNSYLKSQLNDLSNLQQIRKNEFDIFLIKTKLKDVEYKNILNAIVNTEMGYEPALSQIVYFFSDFSENAFVMFDDRSCKSNGI